MNITEDEIIVINQRAMERVDANEFSSAQDLLSQILTKLRETCNPTIGEVITLNNSAFICEKLGNNLKAVTLLLRASQFKPLNPKEYTYSLGTIINLSCINSHTGNLKIALKQAFKAVEMTESDSLIEHKPAAYYNLSCILAKMQKFEKAEFYFGESLNVCKNFLGNYHLLTLACRKQAEICNKKYTTRAKHPSFTSHTAKLTKYTVKIPELEQNSLGNNIKFNSSTRVSSITSHKKSIFAKRITGVGMPYIKEIRYSIRNHFTHLVPRGYNSMIEEKSKYTKLNNSITIEQDSWISKVGSIKQTITKLEKRLNDFLISSRDIYRLAGFMEDVDEDILKNIVKIQKWLRPKLTQKP